MADALTVLKPQYLCVSAIVLTVEYLLANSPAETDDLPEVAVDEMAEPHLAVQDEVDVGLGGLSLLVERLLGFEHVDQSILK